MFHSLPPGIASILAAMDQVLASFSGARVRRVVDHSHGVVGEHAHDWPVLSLFVLGGYRNSSDLGEVEISGPSAMLYRAGAAHSNRIGPVGFEQIEIEFDPAWLGRLPVSDRPVTRWLGGSAAAGVRGLARSCLETADPTALRERLRAFIGSADPQPANSRPAWLEPFERRLRERLGGNVQGAAREMGRHPVWLANIYRQATGEAPSEAKARFRVEQAARLLRETDAAPAQIALETGFCDQSHMIRTFRRLLGRLPSAVRADAAMMRTSG